MNLSVCPAAFIAAPVETVWELLSNPVLRDEWWDAHTERVEPEGNASPGQLIYLTSSALGRQFHGTLRIEQVNPARHQIQWVLSGMGFTNHQNTSCTPIDAVSCRVQYG